jgi:hypothetical protein
MQRTFFWNDPLAIVYVGLMIAVAGCSRGIKEGFHPSEETKMIMPIGSLSDLGTRPDRIAQLFAPGAAPAEPELARFAKYAFFAGKPKASGDEAQVPVTIKEAGTDKIVAEKEWTVVRVGEEWKLKSAPLQ